MYGMSLYAKVLEVNYNQCENKSKQTRYGIMNVTHKIYG